MRGDTPELRHLLVADMRRQAQMRVIEQMRQEAEPPRPGRKPVLPEQPRVLH